MKFVAAPSDEDLLTLNGDFLVIGYPLDDWTQGKILPGTAELVLQVSECGPNEGHWQLLLWAYAYDSDVVQLEGTKRRGSCILAGRVEHPSIGGIYGIDVMNTLFYAVESCQRS